MSQVTLTDVASHVGVSAKTVSNVVNGRGRVSSATRDRVLLAVRELGYQPNLAARQLRGSPSGMITLALPDLRQPYFAELAAHFVTRAQSRGHTVLIRQTGGTHAAEQAVIENEGLPAVDLIVLSPLSLTATDLSTRQSKVPLVLLGEQAEVIDAESATRISASNVEGSRHAVRHLLSRGRTRIAAIGIQHGGPNASSTLRTAGYRLALEEAGIAPSSELMRKVVEFTRAEGSAAMQSMIDEMVSFDAVFCFNDALAFGALHTLAINNLRVPEDVAVVGFDNVEESAYSVPTLTTVGPSPEGISDRVFDIIDHNGGAPSGRHIVDFEVVMRESS